MDSRFKILGGELEASSPPLTICIMSTQSKAVLTLLCALRYAGARYIEVCTNRKHARFNTLDKPATPGLPRVADLSIRQYYDNCQNDI